MKDTRVEAAGVEPFPAYVEGPWKRGMSRLLDDLAKDFSEGSLQDLIDAVAAAAEAGVKDWRPAVQTRYFRLWKERGSASPLARRAATALGLAV